MSGWIDANDWLSYANSPVNITTAGAYDIEYRIASQSGGGNITFEEAGGSNGDASGCAWGMITNSNNGGGISNLNMSTAQIESWFRQFSTQPLVRNESVAYWMNWKAQTGQRIDAEMHRLFYDELTSMVLR